MNRYLAYDPQKLLDLRSVLDAAVWHIAATRFDHAFCEEHRADVLGIRPRLEELRDGVLQPVIDSEALDAFLAGEFTIAPIVVDGELLGTPAEIRGYLEAVASPRPSDVDDHGAVAAAMLCMTPPEAAAYWVGLTQDERTALINDRPDLAALALEGQAVLSSDDLRALDDANAYPQFSEKFGVEIKAEVDIRVATVSLEIGYVVVARMMSDGTVQVAIVKQSEAGAGVAAEGTDGTSVAAAVGAFSSAGRVFLFANEEDAEAALEQLQEEVDTYDFGDGAVDALDWLAGPLWNDANDFEQWIASNWGQRGLLSRDEGGVYGEMAASVESQLAEARGSGRLTVSVYDTDVGPAAPDGAQRTGVVVAGTVSAHAETSAGAGASASGEASFSVDAYTTEDGAEFATITVDGAASAGAIVNFVDFAGVEVDAQAEAGARVTVAVTVPLTSGQIRDVVTAVAGGNVPAGLATVYDDADITVTVDATASTSVEAEIDAGVVEVGAEHTQTTAVNLVTMHKLPDGEFYSQNDLNSTIDEELGIVPTDEELADTYGIDAQVVYDGADPAYIDTGDACVLVPEPDD